MNPEKDSFVLFVYRRYLRFFISDFITVKENNKVIYISLSFSAYRFLDYLFEIT